MKLVSTASAVALSLLPLQQPQEKPVVLPVCNAGGPYAAECNGPIASVQLDGTGSYHPHGLTIRFRWQIECGSGWLDDPTSPTPTLYHPMDACSIACGRVDLIVLSATGSSTSSAFVCVSRSSGTMIWPIITATGAPRTEAMMRWPAASATLFLRNCA